MNLSVIFSKLKPLFPVAVVASSIVITVKLLTSATPSTSEILKVEAKEDIYATNFKDDLVIPEEPPEEIPPEKELEPTKTEEKDDKEESDNKQEENGGEENKQNDQAQVDEKQKNDEKKDQQKPKARRFNPNNPLSDMLSKILGNKGQ